MNKNEYYQKKCEFEGISLISHILKQQKSKHSKNEPKPRGFFTLANDSSKIIVRGYDKFYNLK